MRGRGERRAARGSGRQQQRRAGGSLAVGAAADCACELVADGLTCQGNTAVAAGGCADVSTRSTLTLLSSTITRNEAICQWTHQASDYNVSASTGRRRRLLHTPGKEDSASGVVAWQASFKSVAGGSIGALSGAGGGVSCQGVLIATDTNWSANDAADGGAIAMLPVVDFANRGGGQAPSDALPLPRTLPHEPAAPSPWRRAPRLDIDADTSVECNMASSGGAFAASPDASALTCRRRWHCRGMLLFEARWASSSARTRRRSSPLWVSRLATPRRQVREQQQRQPGLPSFVLPPMDERRARERREPWMNLTRGCDWAEESSRRGGLFAMPARLTWSTRPTLRYVAARAAASPPPTARPSTSPWSTCMGKRVGR